MIYQNNDALIRQAVEEDIDALKDRLCEVEKVEGLKHPGETALRYGFTRSRLCYSVERRGAVVAMFGVVPNEPYPDCGRLWLLCSDEMKHLKKSFVKAGRNIVKELLTENIMLWNYVDARFKKTLGCLKLWGARLLPVERVDGVDVIPFCIGRGDV